MGSNKGINSERWSFQLSHHHRTPSLTDIRMQQSILPPELHQLIINVIGDEVLHAGPVLHSARGRVRETLRACSLVCKAWHASTLPYTFHSARFLMFAGDIPRNEELFRLLKANPSIRRCIRRAEMHLEWDLLPEVVERMSSAIYPLEEFTLVMPFGLPEDPQLLLKALQPTLSSRHLLNLSVDIPYFPLALLENVPNLRSLTLEKVYIAGIGYGDDGPGAWRSSTLEKLVLKRTSRRLLDHIQAVGDIKVALHTFFDRLKYLDMDLYTKDLDPDGSWPILVARWTHLETLVINWSLSGALASIRCLVEHLI